MSYELPSQYTRIILNQRPQRGPLTPQTFKVEQRPTDELTTSMKETDVLVQVDYISLDPAMRGWLNDQRSYIEPVKLGAVMRAGGLGTVVAVGSEVNKVKVGDTVDAMTGTLDRIVSSLLTLSLFRLDGICSTSREICDSGKVRSRPASSEGTS